MGVEGLYSVFSALSGPLLDKLVVMSSTLIALRAGLSRWEAGWVTAGLSIVLRRALLLHAISPIENECGIVRRENSLQYHGNKEVERTTGRDDVPSSAVQPKAKTLGIAHEIWRSQMQRSNIHRSSYYYSMIAHEQGVSLWRHLLSH